MKELFNGIDGVEVVGMILALVSAGFALASLTVAFMMISDETGWALTGISLGVAGIWMALASFLLAEVSHRKANKQIEASLREILCAVKRCECG